MAGGVSEADEGITGINVTPLVDITLVLLIIFMVTTKIVLNQTVPLDLPKAATGTSDVQTVFSIVMAADGRAMVDGTAIPNDDAILQRAKDAAQQHPDMRAVIKADAAVPHGRVIHVLDLLKQAHVNKIAFGVTPAPPVILAEARYDDGRNEWSKEWDERFVASGDARVCRLCHVVRRRSDEQGAGSRREDVGVRSLVRLRLGGDTAHGVADGARAPRRLVARRAHAVRPYQHRRDRDPARRNASSSASPGARSEARTYARSPRARRRARARAASARPRASGEGSDPEPKPDEPVDLTGNTIIQGNADAYAGGFTDRERNERQRRAKPAEPHRRPRRNGRAPGSAPRVDEGPVARSLARRKRGLELPLPAGGGLGADGRGERHAASRRAA